MIALDANVLVRLVTGDDPAQQRRALSYLRKHCSNEDPAWIGVTPLVEFAWTLKNGYEYERSDIAACIERILNTAEFNVESTADAREALALYRKGADFADAFLGERNRTAGCTETATFDPGAAKRLETFALI